MCALGRNEIQYAKLKTKNQHEGNLNRTAEKERKTEVENALHSLSDT